jgi:hypothetical protein
MLSRLKINEAGGWVDPAARVRAHCTGGEEAIHRTADLIISYIRVGLHAFYPTTISALGRFFLGLLHVMTMMMVSRASIKRKCLAPWAPPRILYNPSFTFFFWIRCLPCSTWFMAALLESYCTVVFFFLTIFPARHFTTLSLQLPTENSLSTC